MARDLTGKVIVITGASSGIGEATALRCANAGMHVVLNARRADRLERLATRVRRYDRRAVVVVGDVTDPGNSERVLDAARTEFGRFDVVFANAGFGISKSMLDKSEDELRRLFEVNFFAPVHLLCLAAARLLERGRPGHLLMCSSCLSKFSLPYQGGYAATKAAQNAVCSAMRLEHRDHGIDVTSVHPVTTTTEFFEVAAEHSGQESTPGETPDHAPDMFVQSPDRVARAILKCLRRPCPEVWTSHIVRTVAAFIMLSPRLGDFALRRQMAKEHKAYQGTSQQATAPVGDRGRQAASGAP
jgi:short-subunit dehydrogenase